jgi:quercetin dioxygenase-like cupin family protein
MNLYTFIGELEELLPEIKADTIVSRTVYNDEQMRVTLFGFAAGQELTEHTSAHTAVLHFLQGEAAVTLGEDKKEAHRGSWVHMTPHLAHGILAHTETVMLLIIFKQD